MLLSLPWAEDMTPVMIRRCTRLTAKTITSRRLFACEVAYISDKSAHQRKACFARRVKLTVSAKLTSVLGQSRRFDRAPVTSALHQILLQNPSGLDCRALF